MESLTGIKPEQSLRAITILKLTTQVWEPTFIMNFGWLQQKWVFEILWLQASSQTWVRNLPAGWCQQWRKHSSSSFLISPQESRLRFLNRCSCSGPSIHSTQSIYSGSPSRSIAMEVAPMLWVFVPKSLGLASALFWQSSSWTCVLVLILHFPLYWKTRYSFFACNYGFWLWMTPFIAEIISPCSFTTGTYHCWSGQQWRTSHTNVPNWSRIWFLWISLCRSWMVYKPQKNSQLMPQSKIVMMSTVDQEDLLKESLNVGSVSYIRKPFTKMIYCKFFNLLLNFILLRRGFTCLKWNLF